MKLLQRSFFVFSLLSPGVAWGVELSLEPVVHEGEPTPDGGILGAVTDVAADDGLVYFAGREGSGGPFALYSQNASGQREVLVDQQVPLPDTPGFFYNVEAARLRSTQGVLTFENRSQDNSQRGIYVRDSEGAITLVADRSTSVPGSTTTFQFFNTIVQVGADKTYFEASDTTNRDGIYVVQNGLLSVVADQNTHMPGTGTSFSSFSDLDASGEQLVFTAAAGSARGLFATADKGQSIVTLATNQTPVPGYAGATFDLFGSPLTSGADVLFYAQSTANPNHNFQRTEGIYGYLDGELQVLVDLSTPNPRGGEAGAGGGFASFALVQSFEGDLFTFSAEHDGDAGGDEDGIYLGQLGGPLSLLIEEAESFDGLLTEDLHSADVDANRIVFGFLSDDNDDHYYQATLPSSADFNRDGLVDGRDVLTWQRNFGTDSHFAGGNADRQHGVDAADLATWERQFGEAVVPLVVPEPATVLLGAGLLLQVSFRPKKPKQQETRRRRLAAQAGETSC